MPLRWIRGVSVPVLIAGFLVLLGHDLLMAADPHAAPIAHHETMDPVKITCQELAGRPPTVNIVPDLEPELAALQVPAATLDRRLGVAARHIPPAHPPDVLRALLQVFLN